MSNLDSVDILKPIQLAELLDPGTFAVWNGEDAAMMLRHQLEVPLIPDIYSAPGVEHSFGTTLDLGHWGRQTFAAVLTCQDSPRELLQAIKEFAQHSQNLPESPLRGAAATILYYAAIAACVVHHKIKISGLNPEQLRQGYRWALSQPGIEPLRQIFETALEDR